MNRRHLYPGEIRAHGAEGLVGERFLAEIGDGPALWVIVGEDPDDPEGRVLVLRECVRIRTEVAVVTVHSRPMGRSRRRSIVHEVWHEGRFAGIVYERGPEFHPYLTDRPGGGGHFLRDDPYPTLAKAAGAIAGVHLSRRGEHPDPPQSAGCPDCRLRHDGPECPV